MPTPLVSVIIPTYNSAHYIKAAIAGVLAQSFTDYEILVIDDGSTDDTREILSAYGEPVRYFYQDNAGVSAARNHGIAQSQSRYIAFLDADDAWLPEKLEQQIAALQADSKAKVCYSALLVVDDQLNPIEVRGSKRHGTTLEDLLFHGNIVGTPSSVVVERSLLELASGFDVELSQCADWEMWMRLAQHTQFLYIAQPLVQYRQHGANMSHNIPLLESDTLRALKKGLEHPSTPKALRARAAQALGRQWMVVAGCYFQVRRYRDFARCAARAVRLDFCQMGHLFSFPLRALYRIRSHSAR